MTAKYPLTEEGILRALEFIKRWPNGTHFHCTSQYGERFYEILDIKLEGVLRLALKGLEDEKIESLIREPNGLPEITS